MSTHIIWSTIATSDMAPKTANYSRDEHWVRDGERTFENAGQTSVTMSWYNQGGRAMGKQNSVQNDKRGNL